MATDQQLTRTERRKAATRAALLDAGRGLVAGGRTTEISVQQITEEADVALGTFYNYFADKEDLYAQLLESDHEQHRARLRSLIEPHDSPLTVLAVTTAIGTAHAWMDRGFAAYSFEMHRSGYFPDAALSHNITALHLAAVSAHELAAMSPPVVGSTYFGITMQHASALSSGSLDCALQDCLDELVTVVLRALGASDAACEAAVSTVAERDPASWWSI